MGDIAMGCAIWRWFALPIERPPLRNVERWFEALQQRRAYCKIVIRPLT
jgi:glutathione S-transferase